MERISLRVDGRDDCAQSQSGNRSGGVPVALGNGGFAPFAAGRSPMNKPYGSRYNCPLDRADARVQCAGLFSRSAAAPSRRRATASRHKLLFFAHGRGGQEQAMLCCDQDSSPVLQDDPAFVLCTLRDEIRHWLCPLPRNHRRRAFRPARSATELFSSGSCAAQSDSSVREMPAVSSMNESISSFIPSN